MKKVMVSIVAVFAAMVLVLGMAGCGCSNEEKKINDYIASEDFQSQLKTIKDSAAGMMDVDAKASGNKLCFIMKFNIQLTDDQAKLFKEQFESQDPSQAFGDDESLNKTFEELKTKAGVANPVISLEVQNADGKTIYQTDITPNSK